MDAIEIVKAKVPAEKLPSDPLLDMYESEVRQAILTFCNRSDIPSELVFTQANMIIDLITSENSKTDPNAQKAVSSIKEGDTQINFGGASSSETATQMILNNYKSQLHRFRKMRR